MRILITLLVVGVILSPLMYLLFFTSFVDRWLLKLRTGDRSDTLERAASSVAVEAQRHVEDLVHQREDMAKAMEKLAAVNPLPKATAKRRQPVVYTIQHVKHADLFWSNAYGWVGFGERQRFTAADKKILTLPTGGKWKKEN